MQTVCTLHLQVLDMNKLIQPRLDIEQKKAVEQARKDATEFAIAQVRTRIKEQLEAEQAAKEAAEGKKILVDLKTSLLWEIQNHLIL